MFSFLAQQAEEKVKVTETFSHIEGENTVCYTESMFLSICRTYTPCKDFFFIKVTLFQRPRLTLNCFSFIWVLINFGGGTYPFFNTLYPDVRCFR
jgi:hypothetical protein